MLRLSQLQSNAAIMLRRKCIPGVYTFGYSSIYRHLSSSNSSNVSNSSSDGNSSVEDIYERKTPLEHVLLRPGMYVGQTELTKADTWLFDDALQRMVKKSVEYSPALLKLFDEILINAADNKQRDKAMTKIEITAKVIAADPKVKGAEDILEVSILNDGNGIPVQLHQKEKLYVPELIFGHLLTGSNFNDAESRLTGGSHGYGAKLTNIFSSEFLVETYDAKHKRLYRQQWRDNMHVVGEPQVSDAKLPHSYTRITFQPDLSRFGIPTGERRSVLLQLVKLFERRALDVAASVSPTTAVYFNSTAPLPVRSFQEYAAMFQNSDTAADATAPTSTTDDINTSKRTKRSKSSSSTSSSSVGALSYCKINARWEIAVMPSPSGAFEQLSFVNNVWTARGGTHVAAISSQIVKAFEAALTTSNSSSSSGSGSKGSDDIGVSLSSLIRSKMMLFVNSSIENPAFEGQTKDLLNTKPTLFGSSYKLSAAALKRIVNESGVLQLVQQEIALRELARIADNARIKGSSSSRKLLVDVPKLEDAHRAGDAKHALDCTLILTEGDSAKALAVAGLEVVGRERFGVLPLRGKILNVRVATRRQLSRNKEFANLCKTLGLDFNKSYSEGITAASGLRYGKVLLMCDQDHDGSHIKGLLISLFHFIWPALLQHDSSSGFLQQFITPIVKVRGKKGDPGLPFYSLQEYKQWLSEQKQQQQQQQQQLQVASSTDNSSNNSNNSNNSSSNNSKLENSTNLSNLTVKYYKGLGTNTASEGREYFRELERHRKVFQRSTAVDSDNIEMAFSKHRAKDRRQWLTDKFTAAAYIDPHQPTLSYSEFIDKELIQFSYADIQRSIPSAIDGLKPSQRKVLFGCFKKNLTPTSELKVVQFAGYVAEQTSFHHGEASLHSTIINMAQDFVGANNVPLLRGVGQFGTRAQGGKDFASPRYIYTTAHPLARCLFPIEDDVLLQLLEEDGQQVEPRYFVPIVPTLLLNGSKGIGTGWSTYIPSFNLLDVIDHVRYRIDKEEELEAQTATTTATGDGGKQRAALKAPKPLQPYVNGFKGTIRPHDTKTASNSSNSSNNNSNSISNSSGSMSPVVSVYRSSGVLENLGGCQLRISELPLGRCTENYKKSVLHRLVDRGLVRSFKELHGSDSVLFEVTCAKPFFNSLCSSSNSSSSSDDDSDSDSDSSDSDSSDSVSDGDSCSDNSSSKSSKSKKSKKRSKSSNNDRDSIDKLLTAFKLHSNISMRNMHAFDASGRITKFSSAEEIVELHFPVRLRLYQLRKAALERKLAADEMKARNKSSFINSILRGEVRLVTTATATSVAAGAVQESDLIDSLRSVGFNTEADIAAVEYDTALVQQQVGAATKTTTAAAAAATTTVTATTAGDFSYLLEMPIQSLTTERSAQLQLQSQRAQQRLAELRSCTVLQLWRQELDALSLKYQQLQKEQAMAALK